MIPKILGVILLLSFTLISLATAKTYRRCELAKELKLRHKAPKDQLATWVCIAENGAKYETRSFNKRGLDKWYGIFQINGRHWCDQRPGSGKGCGLPCKRFKDNDLRDDWVCVQKIYNETKRLKGDGFKAWKFYEKHCKGEKSKKYLRYCV